MCDESFDGHDGRDVAVREGASAGESIRMTRSQSRGRGSWVPLYRGPGRGLWGDPGALDAPVQSGSSGRI